jgi:hypothetical protein
LSLSSINLSLKTSQELFQLFLKLFPLFCEYNLTKISFHELQIHHLAFSCSKQSQRISPEFSELLENFSRHKKQFKTFLELFYL